MSSKKKVIIYVGNFSFPFGNASGKRVYGNGKLLRGLGYEVVFVGIDYALHKDSCLLDTKNEFDGFEFFNFAYPQTSVGWFNYRNVANEFLDMIEKRKHDIAAIICYGSPRLSIFINIVRKWCRKNSVEMYSDCVDWLEAKTGNIIHNVIKGLDTYYQKAIVNKKVDGVICISSYLENYYKSYVRKTVVIPPLSTNIPEKMIVQSKKKVFVYAGTPLHRKKAINNLTSLKDRVDKMIEMLFFLKRLDVDFDFFCYGYKKEDYLNHFPWQKEMIEFLDTNIKFCGFVENSVIVDKIKNADFTILMRDIKKSTMAGFPTKVSESISYGTPVITTRTSDIDKYLEENEHVVFVDENNLMKSAKIIKNYIENGLYEHMKKMCEDNRVFYYETFKERMESFINNK